jgi:hypothetical protein
MPDFFSREIGSSSLNETSLSKAFEETREIVNSKISAQDDSLSQYAIATEGFPSLDKQRDLGNLFDSVRTELQSRISSLGIEGAGVAQVNAGATAAVTVSNGQSLRAFVSRAFEPPTTLAGHDRKAGTITTVVGTEGMTDAFVTRRPGMENFDDRDNRNARVTSVAYNLNAAQQNEFGETFFPTVTISNDMVGVAVSVRLISVIKDFTRNADASLADFRRRNVVRALLDHTILKNDTNKLVPHHNAQTAQHFSANIGAFNREVEGVTHVSGALKVNHRIGDLISLGYPEATAHSLNQGDTLDPAISVAAIYLVIGGNKIRLSLNGYKRAGFLAAPEDDNRLQVLNLDIKTLSIKPSTLQFNQAVLTGVLAPAVTNKWTINMRLGLSGNVSVSTGEVIVNGNELSVVSIIDVDGNPVDLTGAQAAAIVAAITKDSIEGWDPDARTSNLNRRMRGQIMDTTVYNQVWTVPLRSPITYPRPVNSTGETDAADLAVLVSTTHARTSNEAVTTLFDAADSLAEYDTVGKLSDLDVIPPEKFGVSRLLLRPTFKYKRIDLTNLVNNVASHEKEKDIAAEIMLNVKNVAYEMFRDSGFQAFIESGAAGVTGAPTILIGTDPYTSRFMWVPGDSRTMGPDFEFKVVTTPDERFQGNVAIAFGYPELFKGEINPAHFGNMLWASETVLVLQMNRSGDAQKETTVQPRFRHIINTPVLGWIVLKGIPEVIATRVPRKFITEGLVKIQQIAADGNITPLTP